MRRATKNGDHESVKLEAHTTKGAAGILGFFRFSNLAKAIEHDVADLNGAALDGRLDVLEAAFAEIKAVVGARLQAPTDADR